MSEESKAVRRAKRLEKAELDRAVRALVRYRRAVEYRKLMEKREEIEKETEELAKRTEELLAYGAQLQADVALATEGLTIIESRPQQ